MVLENVSLPYYTEKRGQSKLDIAPCRSYFRSGCNRCSAHEIA